VTENLGPPRRRPSHRCVCLSQQQSPAIMCSAGQQLGPASPIGRPGPPPGTAGALMPVAFWVRTVPSSADLVPVMDLLVTQCVAAGTVVGFRFYPLDEPYNSPFSSAVSFPVTRILKPGAYLRLQWTGSGTGMELLYRTTIDGDWARVGVASTPPAFANYASCMVYFAPCYQTVDAVSAICISVANLDGELLFTGVQPPVCVLSCQYVVAVQVDVDWLGEEVEPVVMVAADGVRGGVPGAWGAAWVVLKWGRPWVPYTLLALQEGQVGLSVGLYLALVPGQFLPVAYRPYSPDLPAFGAQWVLVATRPIPAGATFAICVTDWVEGIIPADRDPAYLWTATCDVCAGTVIDLTGLGRPGCAAATVGTIEEGSGAPDGTLPLTAFTAYVPEDGAGITATYTCAYLGDVPGCLLPGTSMAAVPWPDCATILAFLTAPAGLTARDWRTRILTSCFQAWIIQPVPTFLGPVGGGPCGAGCTTSCACARPLPSTVGVSPAAAMFGSGCWCGKGHGSSAGCTMSAPYGC